ncbi:response regulator transcription factor [Staphylococcus sp. NRL 16/872]|uniref:response regulator transcription factor n=1 Tax=Staphylococcus sp. NRL 16/872 TaxID=2930131 RepID=UPI001FB383B4|nr:MULTISPECIES: response regulator transcription factor [unclassified Staphylococcus]MCJ1655400.1 response regulator transcription factor [Staphylococcus sp. NRL 21/187]MCJ1661235.1 response regulator transcription factor [Staphylococcus sp. NRL 18/288]MCJ1667125.1 response regulator transcription factor [Staphylococcus sp. NRL 19/737]WEN69607.1 response regulator transcription factor [Staphylococcus sp. NRL 16/872]
MKGYHILIVEDDDTIAKNLQLIFKQNGANVTVDKKGEHVFEVLNNIHLIVMDIMLPTTDGLSITDEIRQFSDVPIIYLSARVDIDSKIAGLGNGDDYLTKPFDPRELISRINNLLEKHYPNNETKLHNYLINIKSKEISDSNGNKLPLTKTETRLFFYLFENINFILTKQQLLNFVWPIESASENTLNAYIKKLRTKLEDDGTIIETIYGIGYRLNGG